jgi:hypothetical protein
MKINPKFLYVYAIAMTFVLAFLVFKDYKSGSGDIGASLLKGSTNRLAKLLESAFPWKILMPANAWIAKS